MGRWSGYFYVPKGAKQVAGFGGGAGTILNADGKKVFTFGDGGFFNVPVKAGQDGRLWKFNSNSGKRILMTVPPYIARSEEELLLPREVIK